MRVVVAGLVALGLAGASSPTHSPEAQAKLDKLLDGRIAGKTRHCLIVRQVLHPIAVDDQTLVFRDGPRIWVSDLRASLQCGQIDKQSDIGYESGANLVCGGSTLYFSNGTLQGACELSDFTLYEKR